MEWRLAGPPSPRPPVIVSERVWRRPVPERETQRDEGCPGGAELDEVRHEGA